jgi:hypothetical protein
MIMCLTELLAKIPTTTRSIGSLTSNSLFYFTSQEYSFITLFEQRVSNIGHINFTVFDCAYGNLIRDTKMQEA